MTRKWSCRKRALVHHEFTTLPPSLLVCMHTALFADLSITELRISLFQLAPTGVGVCLRFRLDAFDAKSVIYWANSRLKCYASRSSRILGSLLLLNSCRAAPVSEGGNRKTNLSGNSLCDSADRSLLVRSLDRQESDISPICTSVCRDPTVPRLLIQSTSHYNASLPLLKDFVYPFTNASPAPKYETWCLVQK